MLLLVSDDDEGACVAGCTGGIGTVVGANIEGVVGGCGGSVGVPRSFWPMLGRSLAAEVQY